MVTSQIRYVACNNIYLSGLRSGLEAVAKNNPAWHYQLVEYSLQDHSDIQILVMDATEYHSVSDVPPDQAKALDSRRTLVLVSAWQRMLISQLANDFRCSVLCVDERSFPMRDIIQLTMKKKRYLSPMIIRRLSPAIPVEKAGFTPAETTVLKYLSKGWSGAEISKMLFRSEKTISTHKRNIMQKLGVRDDFELSQKIHA